MEQFDYNRRIRAMKPSASIALMARAKEMQKTDPTVIGLAAGEPDFPTPERICMEAVRALAEGDTHYTPGPGLPELRQRIREKLAQDNGIRCAAEDILITPGGKNAIFLTVNALLNPGDEAILLDPSWVSYEPIVLSAGGVPVHVRLDWRASYRITREALEAAATPPHQAPHHQLSQQSHRAGALPGGGGYPGGVPAGPSPGGIALRRGV